MMEFTYEVDGGSVAFDVHTHGRYSVLYKGGSGALNEKNLSLVNMGGPSDADLGGSSFQSVKGFHPSLLSTSKGYVVYSTVRRYGEGFINLGNYYTFDGVKVK